MGKGGRDVEGETSYHPDNRQATGVLLGLFCHTNVAFQARFIDVIESPVVQNGMGSKIMCCFRLNIVSVQPD